MNITTTIIIIITIYGTAAIISFLPAQISIGKRCMKLQSHCVRRKFMKKLLNNKFIIAYALIYAATAFALFYIYDMCINSTAVILPALLILSGVTAILQNKSVKFSLAVIPAVSELAFSLLYILLQLTILGPAAPMENLFSAIICGQIVNVTAGIILSVLLLVVSLAKSKRKLCK